MRGNALPFERQSDLRYGKPLPLKTKQFEYSKGRLLKETD